jgi:hypothetical protein
VGLITPTFGRATASLRTIVQNTGTYYTLLSFIRVSKAPDISASLSPVYSFALVVLFFLELIVLGRGRATGLWYTSVKGRELDS